MAANEYDKPLTFGVPTGPREVAAALASGEPIKAVPRPVPVVTATER